VPETVSNTSPLIYLHLLRRLELLPLLFGKIVVPFQVEQELAQGRVRGHDVPDLRQPWIEIRRAGVDHDYAELGPGESGALDLALTSASDFAAWARSESSSKRNDAGIFSECDQN
jgi:predicted nucleic acid-binding protein